MSTETASDVSPVQDEELLRKMWQETEDFGKKKDIRSHMYKIREARLKDFYGTGEEIATSSETRQHSATTTSKTSSGTTGTKVSDLMTHADNLADHSFLSLKSKEIRDSESPTKDSYKITETRKIDDRDWNVVECNEATRDGKTHTTSRIATTSGKQQLDDGELNYAAKSEQKATVYKDGDEKNFTKSVGASSQNVIKQEAFGGDENNKFHSSSTTTSSSSKFTTEKRSTTSDVAEHDSPSIKSSRQISARDFDDPLVKVTSSRPTSDSTVNTAETVVRKVYTENVPNEFKNHPNYIDGKTKVTTETKTLPDGSTITSTRYETKGATQYSTSSASSTTSSSAKHVSSNEQTSSNLTRTAVTTDDTGRNFDGRNISKINDNVTGNDSAEVVRNQRVQSKFVIDANDISRTVKNQLFENRSVNESDVKRTLAERDTMNVQDYDVVVKLHDVTEPETQTVTRITRIIESTYDDKPIKDKNDTTSTVTTVKSYAIPSEESQITTTVHKRVSSQYDKQQLASDDFLNTERVHVVETKNIKPVVTKNEPVCEGIEPIKQIISEAPAHFVEIEFIPNKEKKAEPKYKQPERRHPIKPDKSELDVKVSPTVGQYETTYRSDYVPRRISVEVSPTHDAFARSLRSMSPDRISKTGSIKSLRTTSSTSLRSTNSPDRSAGKPGRTSPVISRPLSPTKKSSKSPEKQITTEFVKNKRHESPGKKFPVTSQKPSDNYLVNVEITTNSGKSSSQLVNTDTVTRRKKITNVQTEIDSNTLTRKKEITESTRSRSVSPTSTASDIEFIRHRTDVVTDLDIDEPNKRFVDKTELNRKDTEDFDERTCKVTTVKKSQKISDKSATTPLINFPTKESTEITNKNKPKSIRRTDTYEERCKEILGISDATDIHRKPSLPNVGRGTPQSPTKSTKTIETSPVKPRDVPTDTPKSSPEKELPSKIRKSLEKELVETLTQKQAATEKVANVQEFATFQTRKIPAKEFSPEKPRVTQQIPSVQEFPSQIRKTPTKEPLEPSPAKHKDIKQTPTVQEFPSQIRKTPAKEPLERYPEKPEDAKQTPIVQEFPSQLRKIPTKESVEPYSEKPKDTKRTSSIQEFPSQIRKMPTKEPLEPHPEKPKGVKQTSSVQEFPSQIRKTPSKEPLEPYPEKPKDIKQTPLVQEFPSQLRKTPTKEPLEPSSEKPKGTKRTPSVQEFPSQTRKSPTKEPLKAYPEKPKDTKQTPSVEELPYQIRKTPTRESIEPYSEKPKDTKQTSSIQEFPSQIRKTPTKEPLVPSSQKPKDTKRTPSIQEFPSQTRKSPTKEPFKAYPEKPKDTKQTPSVEEFPYQIRKTPTKEPIEPYSEKPKDTKRTSSVQEFPSQIRKTPTKEPLVPFSEKPKDTKRTPSIQEFPSHIRKTMTEDSLKSLPEKIKDTKGTPSVQEFPSQIQKTPTKEPLEPYPEKTKDTKQTPSVQEFPPQIRKSQVEEPLEPYLGKPKDTKQISSAEEFLSHITKIPSKEFLESYPGMLEDIKETPVCESPAQVRKTPTKIPLETDQRKPKDTKQIISLQEQSDQIRRTVENKQSQVKSLQVNQTSEPFTGRSSVTKEIPLVITEKEPSEACSEKPKASKKTPSEPDKQPSVARPEKIKSSKQIPVVVKKSPEGVSLDDIPAVKPDTVSLDDIRLVKKAEKSLENIVLNNVEHKFDQPVDEFILSEKEDTEITLRRYKDNTIQLPRGIPDIQSDVKSSKRIKSKVVEKTKKERTTVVEDTSSTSEEEEDEILHIEDQIIEDICDVVECIDKEVTEKEVIEKITETGEKHRLRPEKSEPKIEKKQTPVAKTPNKIKSKPQKDLVPVDDFVTVTKIQLLQSKSKTPVEEPIQTKKFISTLCKEEEEENVVRSRVTLTKGKPNEHLSKPKLDRKTTPTGKSPTKKRQTELFLKKEKQDVNVKAKTTEMKPVSKERVKRIPEQKKISVITKTTDDKKIYTTEYTDEYCITTKDRKTVKPTSNVTTKITLTPTKQTQIKKTIIQDSSIARDVEKVQKIVNGTPSKPRVEKRRPIPKKPEDQPARQSVKPKTTETKQAAAITKTTSQKTVEIQPARRHVVSTVINIKPKIKPETVTRTIHKTTVTKTITAPKTTPKDSKPKPKRIQNGHIFTDDEESDIEIVREDEDVHIKETLKPVRDHITPSRKSPITKPIDSRKKCITTKSILIENAVADQREIIVDLKRSKSSREGTPDRICPYPISSDVDLGVPRYPDRVVEPDDGSFYPKPTRISDIPLNETENVINFDRITEIKEDILKREKTDIEEDTDECLLSVNEKVSKFLSTAEQVTKKPADMKPAPKVERPKLEVDDSLKQDECLLSVSDKVQRFINTAEQLAVGTKETFQRSRSPKYRDVKSKIDDDDHLKPKEKVTPSAFTSQPQEPETIEREQRPLLRKSLSPEKKEYSPRPASRDSRSPNQFDSSSPKYRTPERKSSDLHTRKTTEEIMRIRKESFDDDSTPKTSRRQSKDEPKTILSPTGRLRSTETIKKAKALFENMGRKEDTVKQRDILNRPSVFEGRKLIKTETSEEKTHRDVRTRLTYDEVRKSPSPDKPRTKVKSDYEVPTEEIPHYMTPLDRTLKEHKKMKETDIEGDVESIDSVPSRETSLDRDVPHYMLPLDRTVRERSPYKENLKQLEDIMYKSTGTIHSEEVDVKTTKFGVTLRRTDSGRMITSGRKLSTSSVDQQTTDLEIEEIYDLEYLEKLLETIVGYDIRRRIRAQIRIIKRAIDENTFEVLIRKSSSPPKDRPKRPAEKIEQSKRYLATDKKKHIEESVSQHDTHITETSEYRSSYNKSRRSPVKSPSPSGGRKAPSPKRSKDKSFSPDRKSSIVETDSVETRKVATMTTTRIFQTDLRKTKPASKTVAEEKPEWITQRPLRKVSDTSSPMKKIVTTTTKKAIGSKESEDVKPIDAITSGYGVGPTDENGAPLFGLKALRSQNKSEKTKVQGTVIRSHYYSEDGGEPEGEISITKFSTDPDDLEAKTVTQGSGISSVTTTQKFGYKGTPSLKTITTKTKKTSGGDAEYRSTEKTSKVTRRGSVKEISQKFIENAVDTLKSERQSSYPKAGLILRTSSFKDAASNGTDSSREGSPATQEVHQKIFRSVKTTGTTSDDKKTETFLTNKSKVTDVQDVISRMKSKGTYVEETEEDAEARNLLNKFIGSQVLLSGMESSHGTKPIAATRSTKITTTTTSSESSKPTTVTRTFTHPITAELLETVWDEQTLKLLLEQSTDYEDRRIIRARLREVMAEQEACAELVEKASDEAAMKESGSTVHGTTTGTHTEGPVTATSQVTTRITTQQVKKPMSPFAKFRQLDKQNSLNSPPSTPKSPTGGGPLFKFTDPSLNQSANTVKQRLLQWCQMKTKEYENIQLDNFSTSWADGMAFCALIHHFLPDAFDYKTLNPRNRRHNFTLAFQVADEKAGIAPLLDVDDMVAISRPDWKCVFTYVQSIYRRFKDEE